MTQFSSAHRIIFLVTVMGLVVARVRDSRRVTDRSQVLRIKYMVRFKIT